MIRAFPIYPVPWPTHRIPNKPISSRSSCAINFYDPNTTTATLQRKLALNRCFLWTLPSFTNTTFATTYYTLDNNRLLFPYAPRSIHVHLVMLHRLNGRWSCSLAALVVGNAIILIPNLKYYLYSKELRSSPYTLVLRWWIDLRNSIVLFILLGTHFARGGGVMKH